MRVSRLAWIFIALSAASGAWAQDAVEWFGKAVYTTNPDEQIYFYRKVLEADPAHHQAAHNLAGVYYRKGQVRKSIALYEQLIRGSHAYYQTFYNLACCYARVGDNGHAIKALTRAFQKGFHDRKLVERDEDLAQVRELPEYQALFARYLAGRGSARMAAATVETPVDAAADGQPRKKARRVKKPHPAGDELASSTEPAPAPRTRKPRSTRPVVASRGALDPVQAGVVVEK